MKHLKTNDAAKKRKNLSRPPLNHAKQAGQPETTEKTATNALAKHKNNTQGPAQSAGQTPEHEQAVLKAQNSAHAVATEAGKFKLAAEAAPTTAAQHRYRAALSSGENAYEASDTDAMFSYDPQSGVIYVGQNAEGTTFSITGSQGDRVITGVANGVRD